MATSVIEAPEQQRTAPQSTPQMPAIDSASAVAEATRIVSDPQTAPIVTRAAEASPDLQTWMADVAQRGSAGPGEALLWLVAMVVFLAITSGGIWLNATGAFPHF